MRFDVVEEFLEEVIFPDLLRGRKDFDLPHTKAVVYWMKEIVKLEPQLDSKVLITAAYAHDWGYIDTDTGGSLDKVMAAKEKHMEVGSKRIGELLHKKLADQFTSNQIKRIMHLVYVHDRLQEIKEDDEIALVEADTFGSLDTSLVRPTFSKADNDRYIEQVLLTRRPLFRHQVAIDNFDRLLRSRENFYS